MRGTLDAERQLLKALPKLAKGATSEELQSAFEEHKVQTEEQVGRWETIFESLGKASRGKHCPCMEGLIKEGNELIKEKEPEATLDAAIIGSAQKAEHYQIAAYGTLVSYARLLGMAEAAELLEATLAEKKEIDEKLKAIAANVNGA